MTAIAVQCPDEVLVSLKEDAESFGRDIALTVAMQSYELVRLFSGQAAELAGIARVEFLRRTAAFRVPAWDLTELEQTTCSPNAYSC